MDKDLLSIADARERLRRARHAFRIYRRFDQAAVDRIVYAVVEAGYAAAERLATMAVEETGIGRVEGKIAKNRFATRGLWASIRGMRTAGMLREDTARGIWEVADPFGIVAAIIPTTNPTSTALFKAIICLKSRNAMVASPHPRAAACITESLRICQEAAEAAGAPKDLILCLEHVSLEGTQELMRHKECDLILATGGGALVRAAYSSGKPAFGVGPGNVPVYVDRSADVAHAARCLVESQTFDNATICSSEQAICCDQPVADALLEALIARRAHLCSPDETKKLEQIAQRHGVVNPDIVGLSAAAVARKAGFTVSDETTVLIAPYERHQVGKEHPLSREKLCPLLAFYRVNGWEDGCHLALEILDQGGRGHTLGMHCQNDEIVRAFALEKPANRIIVNSPTAQGAVGFTTGLFPSMTLGCGSFGGNITSDNIGPHHLINVKRVAFAKPSYVDGTLTTDFPALPPLAAGEAARSPWEMATAGTHDCGVSAQSDRVSLTNPAALRPKNEVSPMGSLDRAMPGEHHGPSDLERLIDDALRRLRSSS